MSKILENWKAALTVALVNIPLSISLAIAAGTRPSVGIITAIWAGLLAGIFGGSNYNIVGPTGALSGILAAYAISRGAAMLPVLAIMTGVFTLIFYAFKFDKYIIFVPSSVIHGFTLGIALIISLNQLNFALGLKNLPVHEHFINNVIESFGHISEADVWTFGIFVATLAFLFVWSKWFPKFPAPIIAAPIGILLGYWSSIGRLGLDLQTIFTKFGDIGGKLFQFSFPQLNLFLDTSLIKAALAITVVAILETLISGKIADGLTKTKFNPRKETFGLGLANLASGVFGGLPATAALARTALNIKSGATHKTSAILCAIFVVLIYLAIFPTFRYLPLAVVAAILVYVAIRMVQQEHFKEAYHHDKLVFGLSIVVAIITVVEDPIAGILIGSAVSLLVFVNQISKGQAEVTLSKNKQEIGRITTDELGEAVSKAPDAVVYRFAGQMTYVNAQSHLEALRLISETAKTVILNFRNLFYLDIDGLGALTEIVEELEAKNIKIVVTGVGSFAQTFLEGTDWFRKLKKEGLVFDKTAQALESMGYAL